MMGGEQDMMGHQRRSRMGQMRRRRGGRWRSWCEKRKQIHCQELIERVPSTISFLLNSQPVSTYPSSAFH